jgi:hypothetical protein
MKLVFGAPKFGPFHPIASCHCPPSLTEGQTLAGKLGDRVEGEQERSIGKKNGDKCWPLSGSGLQLAEGKSHMRSILEVR